MNEFRSIFNYCLIVLALSVLLSSCSGGGTQTTAATVMVSTNDNLSNPAPLSGASIEGGVYIFFQEGDDWGARGVVKVIFYCCKSDSGPHIVYPADTVKPYLINVDLSSFVEGTTRELYADVFFNDKTQPIDSFTVNFTISGTPTGNNAPTINGNPSTTIIANTNYSFTPTATDTDGNTLTFSINNVPTWASFDTITGALTGTPANTDLGTTNNIIIHASDGIDTSSLAAFDLTVSTPTTGTATLSWLSPTENNDGSMLVDLAGYKIYYGTNPGMYTTSVPVDMSLSEYVISNLEGPNTYYFSMTAVNSLGYQGIFSNEVSKNIH